MAHSGLQTREQTYRSASQTNDYFVTGLSAVLFLAAGLSFDLGLEPLLRVVDTAAIFLFALSVVAGLKKLEYYVAVLGADYSIALTESNQGNLTVRESSALLRDLNETVENLTNRASVVHRLRTWFLVLGMLAMIASRLLQVVQAS